MALQTFGKSVSDLRLSFWKGPAQEALEELSFFLYVPPCTFRITGAYSGRRKYKRGAGSLSMAQIFGLGRITSRICRNSLPHFARERSSIRSSMAVLGMKMPYGLLGRSHSDLSGRLRQADLTALARQSRYLRG